MGFLLEPSEYGRDYDLKNNYTLDMVKGLMAVKKIDKDTATKFVKRIVEERNPKKIKATFTLRNKHGDRSVVTRPLLEYLDTIITQRLGMAPTMTTYRRPDVKTSMITGDIVSGKARRKKVKNQALDDKNAGRVIAATIGKGVQNAIKILINSWSGASLSPHNPYFNRSTHPALTTMCRIATALATASVERLLAGKRYYHCPERVIEDILVSTRRMPKAAFHDVVLKYKLHLPSVDELMEMITRSSDYYWWSDEHTAQIRELVVSLTDDERAYVMYQGDLYHLMKYNTELVHTIFDRVTRTEGIPDTDLEDLPKMDGDQSMFLDYLMGPKIRGMGRRDAFKKIPGMRNEFIKVGDHVMRTLHDYNSLFETLFRAQTPPIDVGRQDNAIRLTVPLGDTDSTVFSTKHISEMYLKDSETPDNRPNVVNFAIYMVNCVVTHALRFFSAQMGIVEEKLDVIMMKSEFSMPFIQLTSAGKTYHGAVAACEGRVYKKLDFELKGARLHGGRNNQTMIKELKDWMVKAKTEYVYEGKKVDRGELVDMILDIEYDLVDSLKRTENVYYQIMKVKAKEEYKNPYSDAYAPHRFWELVFGPQYGKAPPPEYTAYKVPANFPNGFENWVRELPAQMQQGVQKWLEESGRTFKKPPTYFVIPVDLFQTVGTPKEMASAVHMLKLAKTSLDPHYLNLGSLGLNMEFDNPERGRLLSDMIPQAADDAETFEDEFLQQAS